MSNTFSVNRANAQPSMGRHIPYGWIILGFFLSPILGLLVWANYQLLGLGLEAVFGLNRIEWPILGRVVSIQDVIATATICGEVLAGFLFAELAGWINLLDFDEHLQQGARRCLRWIALALFFSLIAGEVGIGLYRQNVIDKQSREYSDKLHELSGPISPQPSVDKRGEIDLTKNLREKSNKASASPDSSAKKAAEPTTSGWASFIDSLPFAATVFIHVAIPCLTAAIGVIMSPLTFFTCGLALTLVGVMPLSFGCVALDLASRALHGIRSIGESLLNLIAAPARILVEGFTHWRRSRVNHS
jgi:hypothetical protein